MKIIWTRFRFYYFNGRKQRTKPTDTNHK